MTRQEKTSRGGSHMNNKKNGVVDEMDAPAERAEVFSESDHPFLEDVGVDPKNRSVATVLGEISWLMTQSPFHKHLTLSDLEWLVMPPILLRQFRIYYQNTTPFAVVSWAYANEEAEAKLSSGNFKLRPDQWRSGELNDAAVTDEAASVAKDSNGGTPWIVDLVCPQANDENKLVERILDDLTKNVFANKAFKFSRVSTKTGKREIITLGTGA